ncbi:Retrovirus-related Pol poly from transposon [Paramuricea clavata]|uniref:Retrovirus-related Pol poly from transposon n=1 Tax=Paramuricea clavata TaxID=317549 RepID=A0A6S7ITI6_PARCT|nr:Retrovirus-related Pol poly from transposon [Paramuricea clavata]
MAFSAPFLAPQMDWETNDSILAFGKFKQKCELMFKSILKDAEGEEQVSYILLWVGEQGLDIYNSWTFEDVKDQKDPAKILDRFMEHLEPRTNHRIHRLLYKVCDKTKVSQSIILLPRLKISQLNASLMAMKKSRTDY